MATSNSPLRLFDETHDITTTALAVTAAVITGIYGAWIAAGFLPRPLTFVVIATLVGVGAYRQSTTRGVISRALYGLAAVLALTPIALNIPVLLTANMPGVSVPLARVLTVSDLKILLVFLGVAAVPAAIGYYLTNTATVRGHLARLKPS